MEKFIRIIEGAIVPVTTKIGNNKYLLAIRDAFIGMLAITMVGSFAVLINQLPRVKGFLWFGDFMQGIFGAQWRTLNDMIWFGTLACLSIFVVFGISNRLAKNLGDDGFEAMLVAGACYFALLPQMRVIEVSVNGKSTIGDKWGMVAWKGTFDGNGVFFAMIVAILATVLFVNLSKLRFLVIKLPDGVPPAVSKAFAKLLPGMLTIFIFALSGLLFGLWMSPDGTFAGFDKVNSMQEQIMKWIVPGINKVDSLPAIMLIVFLIHLFWFVGLHGSNILLGVTAPVMITLGSQNAGLYKQSVAVSTGKYATVAGPFLDAFVNLGGPGCTLGLLIALFIFGRKKRKLAGLALPPGIFQINEPVLFGLPMVLNPVYFIPLLLSPLVLTVIAYLSIKLGIVHPVVVVTMPWVTPVGLGGYIATGGHISGLVLSVVNFLISIFIYAPFVIIGERIESKQIIESGNGFQV